MIALIIIGLLTFKFLKILFEEPTPNKSEVEEMVNVNDLVEFGNVEGSYLYTPKNFGYYNENCIYIVEKYLVNGEQYDDQYVVIKKGEKITSNDKLLVKQIKREYSSSGRLKDVQVKSKHKVLLYKDNEKVKEDWFFKVVFAADGRKILSFVSPKQDANDKFNFFTKGYEQFLNF